MSNPCFYVADAETLAPESTAVCLSLAMVFVEPNSLDPDPNKAYNQLLESSMMVKFDVKEQFKRKRISTKDTIDWWGRQDPIARISSYVPREDDLSVEEGLRIFNDFYKKDTSVWTRGVLDPMIIDSMHRAWELKSKIHYNAFRDVRTFISMVYPLSKGGYVDIPDFDKDQVLKHIPTHDCAYDALMMLRGEVEAF